MPNNNDSLRRILTLDFRPQVKHDEDETHSDTEILVQEEDEPILEPVVEEPCGVIDRAKGWMANFLLGRTSQCVQRQTYPPVEVSSRQWLVWMGCDQ